MKNIRFLSLALLIISIGFISLQLYKAPRTARADVNSLNIGSTGNAAQALGDLKITRGLAVGSYSAPTTAGNAIFSGSLGIGTTSPTALLDVAGNASGSGTLSFRGTTDPKINILNGENFGISTSVGGDTGLSERLTILNSGNVGIGTTAPNTGSKLDVRGGLSLNQTQVTTQRGTRLDIGWAGSGNADIFFGDYTNGWAIGENVDASMRIFKTSGTALTDLITIQNGGNVGIGTMGPNGKLDVFEDGTGGAWRGRIISRNSTANVASFLGNYNSHPGVFAHNNALSAWNTLYVNTTDGASDGGNVLLAGAGSVGIGTSPGYKLDVSGTLRSTGVAYLNTGFDHARLANTAFQNNTTLAGGIYTNNGTGLQNAAGTATALDGWWHVINMHHQDNNGFNAQISTPLSSSLNDLYWRNSSGGTWTEWRKILSENTSGNVGIGITNPVTKFVVSNSGAQGIEFHPTGAGGGGGEAYLQVYNRSTSAYGTMAYIGASHDFYTNGYGYNAMTITNGGSVGIMTVTPGSYLDGTSGLAVYNASYPGIAWGNASGHYLIYMTGTNLRFYNGAERIEIDSGGNTSIGTTAHSAKLQVNGTVAYTIPTTFAGANQNATWNTGYTTQAMNVSILSSSNIVSGAGVFAASDERIKKNIEPISQEIVDRFIANAHPVNFNWKETSTFDSGFIAQDLINEGLGYLVSGIPDSSLQAETNSDGITSPAGTRFVVNYSSIIPILTTKAQQQQQQIESLQKKIDSQQKQIDELKRVVEELKLGR